METKSEVEKVMAAIDKKLKQQEVSRKKELARNTTVNTRAGKILI